jgi:repressor LexA
VNIGGFKMLSKEDLGEYLKKLRNDKHLSLREVNHITDISYSHLNMIENGKRNVTPALLRVLADLYCVDYLDLYEKAGYIDLIEDEKKRVYKLDKLGNSVVSVNILGTVKAGYDYLAQENIIGTVDVETSLVGDGSDFFALKVKGDSMSPIFIEDDIVIVKRQNDCENNEIAIVIVNGDEGTIKKIRKTEQGIILQPLNPVYTPLIFTNEEIKNMPVTIVGVVKQLKREF